MNTVAIAYPALCIGFCLGFAACAVLCTNRRKG